MSKKNWLSELKSFNPNGVQKDKKGKKTKNNVIDEPAILVEEVSQIPTNPV